MNFFNGWISSTESFWIPCQCENENVEVPLMKGAVYLAESSEPRFIWLYGSILAISADDTSHEFIGYADIRYYSLKYQLRETDQENYIGFELQQSIGKTESIFPVDKTTFNQWDEALRSLCILTVVDFDLYEHIARGGFADVYNSSAGDAIKIMHKRDINHPARKEQIKREIDIQRQCDHPNLVKLIAVYETELTIMLRMERVDGKDLRQILHENGPFSEEQSRLIIEQVLRSAQYLHRLNIMHLDFKPANIMLTERNVVKVIDFGLARKFTWPLKVRCGTIGYAAPEIFKNAEIDSSSDIFSIGQSLYMMLTNDKISDANFKKIFGKMTLNPTKVKHLTKPVMDLITWMRSDDSKDRPSADEALNSPWFRSEEETPDSPRRLRKPKPALSWSDVNYAENN